MNDRIADLIVSHLNDELTATEKNELDSWLSAAEANRVLFDRLVQEDYLLSRVTRHRERGEAILQKIREQLQQTEQGEPTDALPAPVIPFRKPFWRRPMAAAILLLFIGGIVLYYWKQQQTAVTPHTTTTTPTIADVAPGQQKASLTLADGSTILLDSAANGQLAQQGTAVVKNHAGQLIYSKSNNSTTNLLYNTLRTSKGQMYAMTLSDGTRVWLNAGSSLRFPVVFGRTERTVILTGEGYFEVAKNEAAPFVVTAGDVNVQVLGTHFNVRSYDDAPIQTTLLEGAIQVQQGSAVKNIKPGQQAETVNAAADPAITVHNTVDVERIVAWKNGYFHFNQSPVEEVMNELSKWYDVKVIYKDKIPNLFDGEIPRQVSLSVAIEMLELTGSVQLKIEGRNLVVEKKAKTH
jgi:transmembrane sensor